MILFILTVINCWVAMGLFWLIAEWIQDWEKVLKDQKGLKRHMDSIREHGGNPRVSAAISVVVTYVALGPFGIMLPEYRW